MVREALAAVNERDLDRIVAFAHPESELELIGGFEHIMGHSMFKGPDGARQFFADWFEAFATSHAEPTRFLEAGDQVVVLIDLEAKGAGDHTDPPVNLSFGAVFSFKDGRIRRLAFYYNAADALEAVGLSE